MSTYDENTRALISHYIWNHQNDEYLPEIGVELVDEIKKKSIPSPFEKFSLFIKYLGDLHYGKPGVPCELQTVEVRAKISSFINADVLFCFGTAKDDEYVEEIGSSTIHSFSTILTIKGWKFYDEIEKSISTSNTAFMAMQFDNEELDKLVEEHFKPAVEKTGLELRKVIGEHQPAGLIDDHIVVAIRTSKIVIADLSDGNKGAYWEAGLAEGLGIPVIYLCDKRVMDAKDDESQNKPHFDTNHRHTVPWDIDNPEDAVNKIKDIIRATLPNDEVIKMVDEEPMG